MFELVSEYKPTGDQPEAINKLKNEMFRSQIPFRINRKYLNKKIGELEYNNVIGELANTNIEPGFVTTTNNWFTIAPVLPDGTVQKIKKEDKIKTIGVNPSSNTSNPTTPTKKGIQWGNKTFYVDEQWNVTDETGKVYNKGENTHEAVSEGTGLRPVSHAQIPSLCCGRKGKRPRDLPPEHRPARYRDSSRIL